MSVTVLKELPKDRKDILWLSVSKYKTFKDCKAKFKYNYIEKMPKQDHSYLIFGKLLHRALELFHAKYLNGASADFNIIMKEAFQEAYSEYKSISQEEFDEAKVILINYINKLAEKRNAGIMPEVLYTEFPFAIDIDGVVLLNGSIDCVQRDPDGMLHIADYKTTKPSSKKYLKADTLQLLTYAFVLCAADESIERIRTSYIMLKNDMEPIIQEFSRAEAMEVENRFLEYAALMKVEQAYNPNPTPLCKHCDYLEHCIEGTKFVAKLNSRNKPPAKPGKANWSDL